MGRYIKEEDVPSIKKEMRATTSVRSTRNQNRYYSKCLDCDVIFEATSEYTKYCPSCAAKRKAAKTEQHTHYAVPKNAKKLTLGQIAKLASDEGLTYGQYLVKHQLY